jgi:hypothetical protein
MSTPSPILLSAPKAVHPWLRKISIAYLLGPGTPLIDSFARELMRHFSDQRHEVQTIPQGDLDVLLTTAGYNTPVNWREAQLLRARRQFHLAHNPTVFTLVNMTSQQFHELLAYFEVVLAKEPADPADFKFPGLASNAYRTLYEQGRRGGPMLALVRLLQSQTMCVRIILVIGDDRPLEAYTFDLVGAHPRSLASDGAAFYDDLLSRIVTSVSTFEITNHQVIGGPIQQTVWQTLNTPEAMKVAGRELGSRQFFTEMVRVDNLVNAPAVHEAVSSQYSEGCYATWEPGLDALVATVTGSARPVVKDKLTDDELAVIYAVRPDGLGAQIRYIDGTRHDPPSSEAVELIGLDRSLPRIHLTPEWGIQADVPVARSKLHGHRGVGGYDPRLVEHVALEPAYYHYPVSCSTEAQARAINAAFGHSEALCYPDDPRQVVFTVLPGHGVVIVEKWVAGKAPFQVMWELMDSGQLQVVNLVPQGPLTFEPVEEGMMKLVEV